MVHLLRASVNLPASKRAAFSKAREACGCTYIERVKVLPVVDSFAVKLLGLRASHHLRFAQKADRYAVLYRGQPGCPDGFRMKRVTCKEYYRYLHIIYSKD